MRKLAICLGVVVMMASLWPTSKATTFQFFGETIARVETDRPVVSLTLDDGPSRRYTTAVLDILAQKDARATFFLTGHEAAENPELAAMIARKGHELGNHSFRHDRMILKTPAWIRNDLAATDAALRAAGATGTIHFRPPFGQKLFVLPWVLSADRRPSIMWDVTVDDEGLSAQALADQIVSRAQPGSIILMHVMYRSRETSRAAMPLVIDGLREKGLELVTVSDLLGGRS